MKKALGLAVLMLFVGSTAAMAQIATSSHDLSGAAWNTADQNLCEVCHTPHNAVSAIVPLWDRDTPASTFTGYTANSGQIGTPTGISLACLSCHDGVTNLDAYGDNSPGTVAMGAVPANMGIDLSDDHPVSVRYTLGIDMEGNTPTNLDVRLFTNGPNADMVECASCHAVHNDGAAGPGTSNMLATSNTGSLMCLACHAK
jgi:hypothetical protein